jgi:hypothetical protein
VGTRPLCLVAAAEAQMLVTDFFVYYSILTFEIGTSRGLLMGVSVHAPTLNRNRDIAASLRSTNFERTCAVG